MEEKKVARMAGIRVPADVGDGKTASFHCENGLTLCLPALVAASDSGDQLGPSRKFSMMKLIG